MCFLTFNYYSQKSSPVQVVHFFQKYALKLSILFER